MAEKPWELVGNGPFPFPTEKFEDFMECCPSKGVAVCLSRAALSFSEIPDSHCHNSYEFVIPSDPMPYNGMEKKCLPIKANTLLSINPWQHHGTVGKMHINSLLAVHISRDLINEFSKEIFNRSEFYFDNHHQRPAAEIRQLLLRFINEYRNKQSGYRFILESLSSQLTIQLLRMEREALIDRKPAGKQTNHKSIQRIKEFLQEHYNSNDYSSLEIAQMANLSPYHFIRIFKQETGKTPYEFLTDIKIEKAKALLEDNYYTITEVGNLCGFTSHSHFTATFKKRVGVPPSEYRKVSQ